LHLHIYTFIVKKTKNVQITLLCEIYTLTNAFYFYLFSLFKMNKDNKAD